MAGVRQPFWPPEATGRQISLSRITPWPGLVFVHKPLSHRQWSTSHVLDILTMSMFSVDWDLRRIGKMAIWVIRAGWIGENEGKQLRDHNDESRS